MKKKQALKKKLILGKKMVLKLTREEMHQLKGGGEYFLLTSLQNEKYSMMDDCSLSTKIV